MSLLRGVLKHSAEIVLYRAGVARMARVRMIGTTLVLAYHNIVPDGERARGDGSLHLAQRSFSSQLDELQRTHDVVPLTAVLERSTSKRARAAITFDDATRGALTAGLEELIRRRLTATFFVAPAFVPGASFWWDALPHLDPQLREHALTALGGSDGEVRTWAAARGIALEHVPLHQRCGTEALLRAAVSEGMSLGSHTWSHRNLAAVPAEELFDELVRPLVWLRERFSTVLPWLAFPYGLYSREAITAARELGYEAALRVDGGWFGPTPPEGEARFELPRLNVPAGLTREGLALRAAGLIRNG